MVSTNMKQLLEAGVHFGHQTRRWNPKMQKYIFGERNGIYIIDLQKTVKKIKEAYNFVKETAQSGQPILFVGTKKQAQESIEQEAIRCGMFFVSQRWLGGMMTNFKTILKNIERLKELERMKAEGIFAKVPKQELVSLEKELAKAQKIFNGIKEMNQVPGAIFIIDPKRERNAVLEARKLHIPIIALVDTNCDPDEIDYIIPGNDDAIRSVKLIANLVAEAVLEGRPKPVVQEPVAVPVELLEQNIVLSENPAPAEPVAVKAEVSGEMVEKLLAGS